MTQDRLGTVIHFSTQAGGGVVSAIRTLAMEHRPRWRQMWVCTYRDKINADLVAEAQEVFDRTLLMRRPPVTGIYYLRPLHVHKALRQLQVDPARERVVFHFYNAAATPWVFRLPPKGTPGRFLSAFHGARGNFYDDKPHQFVKRFLSVLGARTMRRRKFAFCTVSRQSAEDCAAFYRLAPSDFHVIYNGVAPASEAPRAVTRDRAAPFHVGFTGTITPIKGWCKVIRACEILRSEGVALRCTIAGGGPEYDQLREMAGDRREWLHAPGHVPRAGWSVVPSFDALVLPSDFEGFPICLVEACAAGVPSVCSDVGGNREIVRDNVDGLVLRDNTPEEIAACLGRLARDDRLWTSCSFACRKHYEEDFTAKAMAAAYERIYLETP